MKHSRLAAHDAVLLLLSILILQPSILHAQGSLTPPGAPAPTMKTLDQVEPRTIVNAANTPGDSTDSFIISQPGSYYLTTNLVGVSAKNGIEITANNVTLDLNGFVVQGVPGSVRGIYVPNPQVNITVRNGAVNGWAKNGVLVNSALSLNVMLERLEASTNGFDGIDGGGGSVARDCNCQNNGQAGINFGSGGIITGCTAQNNGTYGIIAAQGFVSGCYALNNVSDGINVAPGTVTGCYVSGNAGSGIYVNAPGSLVSGNNCVGNNPANSSGSAGIYINSAHNRIEDNHVTASGYAGIQVNSFPGETNNLIVRNSVEGTAGANYILPNVQIIGPIVTNTVSGTITNSNPWANFSF